MTLLQCASTNDLLPDKVLIKIFNHLDLENLKNATLSCRRWHSVAFMSAYIKRFKFQLALPQLSAYFKEEEQMKTIQKEIKKKKEKNKKNKKNQSQKNQNQKDENEKIENEMILAEMTKMMIKKVIDIVDNSVRHYDNLRLIILPYMIPEFLPLWKSLYPKIARNIHSLELDFKQAADHNIAALLAPTIELMSNLRSLSIWSLSSPSSDIVFRHSSVQHLKMYCTNNISVDMPNLQTFEGPLGALKKPYPTSQPLVLTQLKHVMLTLGSDNYSVPSIIYRLTQVETMNLMSRLMEDLFYAICDACTALKELNFWHVSVTDRATTSHLSRLVNLRQLTFQSISLEGIYSFDLDFVLRELTQLEDLDIGFIVLGITSVVCLPMSVKVLTVSISAQNEVNVMQNIINTLPQLQKLRLVYHASKTKEASRYTIQSLNFLEQPEELEFVNAQFSEPVYLGQLVYQGQRMNRLRNLRFENSNLNDEHIKELQENFGIRAQVKAFKYEAESIPTTINELFKQRR